jgi:putative ABC transport system permease protein
MDALVHDLRYAFRGLRRSRGFTLVAVATLALGIGAATTLFTVVDGVLLKPLAYPDADRIVAVVNFYTDSTARVTSRPSNLTGGDLIDIAAEPELFEAISYYVGGESGVQLAGRAEFVGVRIVHPDFFRIFGIAPVAGRTFARDDAERAAVVSAGFANRNFGAAAAALGKSVFFESRSYEIVGVMPTAMQFPATNEVWAAGPLLPENRNRTGHNYRTVAKLAAGSSIESANARLSALAERLAAMFPVSNRGKNFETIALRDNLVTAVRQTLYVLMGAVALVLLIACANVANLMLARGAVRTREVAVRAALGASSAVIARQLLVEGLVLSAMASGLGLLVAYVATGALLQLGAQYVPLPRLADVHVDWRVLAFSAGTSILTTIAFGLAPALHASRISVTGALAEGARGQVGTRSSRMRSGLVVAQIALSYVLAINAGLLFRSFASLVDTPLGYDRSSVLVMYAHAPARGSIFENAGIENYLRAGRLLDDIVTSVRRLPNVVSAGAAMGLPTGQYDSSGSYAIEGKHVFGGDFRKLPYAGFRLAGPGYFGTMRIPLVRGRDFTDADLYDRPFVAIVSQSLARATFGDEDPIGHRVMCGLDQPDKWMTIVGVVGDVRQASPASKPGPELYMPLRQHPYVANEVQVVVRSHVPPDSMIATLRQTVRSIDPEVATKFTTLEASVGASIAAPRFRATLISAFAAIAILLALAGIYGVMSYLTAQRRAEFGLRVALGAATGDVVRLVLAHGGRLVLAGTALGLSLAIAASRVAASFLFGVASTDVPTYAAVLVTAMPLITAAAAIPAFRAARVDPITALRAE